MRSRRAWVFAYAIGWAGFLVLLAAARRSSSFPPDLPIAQALQHQANPALTTAMLAITAAGGTLAALILLGSAGLLAVIRRWWAEAITVLLSPIGAALDVGAKLVSHRQRPSGDQLHVDAPEKDFSFPSGHVFFATYFFGLAILFLLVRGPSSPPRNAAIALLSVLILLVGISRIYLGSHWPSDVLGGYWLGGLWLVTLAALYGQLRRQAFPAVPS